MTGETLCRHTSTKGAVICADCSKNVSVYPWQLDKIKDEAYRKGLHAQVIRGMTAFKIGIFFGVIIAFISICIFDRIFSL